MIRFAFLLSALAALCFPAFLRADQISILTHNSFNISKELAAEFEKRSGHTLEFVTGGDGMALVTQSVLNRDRPRFDLVYGLDNSFLSRVLERFDIFEATQPKGTENLRPELRLDPKGRLWPVDFGDVTFNYDLKYLRDHDLPAPKSLKALAEPAWKDRVVVSNPQSSTPGMAFLLLTVAVFGEDGFLDYWRALKDNGLMVAPSWETAYYDHFSATGGSRPVVLSYASSPAAEMIYSSVKPDQPGTAAILAEGQALRQVEFVGLFKNAPHRKAALEALDWFLSPEFQEQVPMGMFVYPVNQGVSLPEVFERFAPPAAGPVVMDTDLVNNKGEMWLRQWRALMGQ